MDKPSNPVLGSMPDLPDGYRRTELGPLPEEWRVVRLGEVGRISAGGSAPQGTQYFGGTHPFVRVQHLDEDGYEVRRCDLITEAAVRKYRLRLFPSGTIVFPKSGASIRLEKRAVLSRPSYLVSHLCALIPKEERVDGTFLFFTLKSIPLAAEKAEGYPTLSLTEIKQTAIPLPPLPEQRAIAHVLRTVQRAKEATERVIQATRELKKSLMRHLFTYGPVPLDQAAQVPLQETALGPLPAHWQVVRLGNVFEIQQGKSLSPKSRSGPRMRPFLRTANVFWGRLDLNNVDQMHFDESEERRLALKPGDLLVCEGGDIGRTAIWEGQLPLCLYQNHLHRLRSLREDVFSLLYMYWMQAAWTLLGLYGGSGNKTTIPNLSQSRLASFLIPLPPLSEQREIARILQAVDQKIQAEEKSKKAIEILFRTLLQHLMTGKIRAINLKEE
ncbi:restriction endonuclease subunit S [Thermanaerothrix sp.]|uniref:restriction endonuclease subunit S n=1 Tax=Thermanaerothrix sp. TaxID=2972675 RepID=UPI003C7C4373